jgi:hypothetical protein
VFTYALVDRLNPWIRHPSPVGKRQVKMKIDWQTFRYWGFWCAIGLVSALYVAWIIANWDK